MEAGGWLTIAQQAPVQTRDRVGRHAANTLFGGQPRPYPEQYARADRLLDDEQLWLVYQRTPDVRAAIDAIVRRVATWDWYIEPTLKPSDPAWESTAVEAEEATRFLQTPNTDGETWQELWTKTCTDLMVFDAGVIENVFDGERNEDGSVDVGDHLQELVALRGSSIYPAVDSWGHLLGYRQNATGMMGVWTIDDASTDTSSPRFAPAQIVYLRLFPNTAAPIGVPLIETIVNEVITMMRSSEHSMLAFDADEIPPGILVLTGIAGKAAQAAKADLQMLRGKDHKVRVITNPDPKATGANWVELRRTAKDVDFVNVINQVRRTIWRVFGVMPVEMGASEDIPRNLGQVQLDVSASHLITPILELIEAKVNARILPLVIGDATASRRLRFRFDRESKLNATDQKHMADTLVTLVREGILTRNEARAIRGDAPTNGGDVMTLTTGQGVFSLEKVVLGDAGAGTLPTEQPGIPEETPEIPAAEFEEPPGGVGDEATPVDAASSTIANPLAAPPQQRALLDDMPSEWQPEGPFAGMRTIDLLALADVVADYVRVIRPLYAKAMVEVVGTLSASYRPDSLTDDDAAALTQRAMAILDKLGVEWSIATESLYIRAAQVGNVAARDLTGLPVTSGWRIRAMQYGDRAMQFLRGPGGLLADLRARVGATVASLTANRAAGRAPRGLDSLVSVTVAAEAMTHVFDSEEFRIANWAGRLVELANEMLSSGVLEGSTVVRDGAPQPVEWWVEWVSVGDKHMCTTCDAEGAIGFRPLSTLTTVPGGNTECRARCRCVLVLWTKDEIQGGQAVRLGPLE